MIARKQSEKLLIEGNDTFVVIPYMRAKVLFEQLAKHSEYKRIADSTMANQDSLLSSKDSTIASKTKTEIELKQAVDFAQQIIDEKMNQIESYVRTLAIQTKRWIKIVIYSCGGSAVAGIITGILIAK